MNPDRFDVFTGQLAMLGHRRALLKRALAAIALITWGGLAKVVVGQETCPAGCAEN